VVASASVLALQKHFLQGARCSASMLIFFPASLKLCLTTLGACLIAVTLTSQREYNANWLNRDNSTRGLDSATALKFVKTLRTSSSIIGTTSIVAIYQASQTAYDVRGPLSEG
jgi:hypothetical protein